MKKADIWLLAIVVAIASVFIIPLLFKDHQAPGNGVQYARVTVDGKPYKMLELTDEKQELEIQTKFGYNHLVVHDGGIEMTEADCPDKLCLTFGHVKNIGQTIICLPHRVMVEIVSDNGSGGEVDGVAA
ncbi:MAG: NusG domain II-containing protein [Gorillibacterium sp.]|nr:NusG domain II-containing protein [Gorillibacterium sp.]